MKVPPLPRQTGGPFFETYTRGLTKTDIERLFTRDTLEAYKFFSRNIDFDELKKQRWHRRMLGHARLLFLGFTLKLTPARRLIYGISLVACLIGLMELFREVHFLLIPHPAFALQEQPSSHDPCRSRAMGGSAEPRPVIGTVSFRWLSDA